MRPGPRTVLYLHSSAGRYGADRQLLALVGALDPAAFRARVVLAEDGPLAGDLREAGAEVAVRRLAVLRREAMHPSGLAGLARDLGCDARALAAHSRGGGTGRGADLVHTNTSVTLGGAAAARAAGIPHVWHVREIYAEFARWWPGLRALLSTADALPCVSEPVREQFDGHRSGGRASVIPDGVPPPAAMPERAAARLELGVPDGAFVVAVLGRLSTWKGQEVLVDALAAPGLAGDPDAIALVAGDAWRGAPGPAAALRERAAAAGVADRVRLVGFVDPVAAVYAAADVVVVPSTRPDPLPNSALEAAAAGCCVVAADHGGLPVALDGGRAGVLVPPGDATALGAALAALRDDPARRAELGRRARSHAAEQFGVARLADRVQALYEDVLAARS